MSVFYNASSKSQILANQEQFGFLYSVVILIRSRI